MSSVHAWVKGNSIVLSCLYGHPAIDKIRNFSARTYNAGTKTWSIPLTPDAWKEACQAIGSDLVPDESVVTALVTVQQVRDAALAIRSMGDAYLGTFSFVTPPWSHQRAAVAMTRDLEGLALFWEMGTGKTKAAIDIMRWRKEHIGLTRVLVVAPNEVIWNWKREVERHASPEQALVLEGSLKLRENVLRNDRLPLFTIMNCEVVAQLEDAIRSQRWGAIIVDESTRFKNPSAKRTQALMRCASSADFRLIMTGTPIVQHLIDIYSQLSFVEPGMFGTPNQFKYGYFYQDWAGNWLPQKEKIDGLVRMIDARSYRTTKKEVLPELPEKMPPQYLIFEMGGEQKSAYKQMEKDYKVFLETLLGDVTTHASIILVQKLRHSEITSGFIRNAEGKVHHFADNPKARILDNLIEDLMPGKVVIFCNWRPEVEFYAERYKRWGTTLLYGGVPAKERDERVAQFQDPDSDVRVLVAQEGSGGIGINLTAASTCIYTSRSWSLEQWLQSQDRLHRAGQKNPVNIIIIQAKGSVDEDIDDVLTGKMKVADIVTRDSVRVRKG